MRSRYLLAPLLLLATVCMQRAHGQAEPDSSVKQADPDPAAVHQTVLQVKQAYVATTSAVVAIQDPEASAERQDEAQEKFKELNEELAEASKAYTAKMRAARSAADRNEALKSNPMIELGPKFVEFAKEYEGTDQAYSALITVGSRGVGESKTEAMNKLLGYIQEDPESRKSMSALTILALEGAGEPKTKAMAMLLATTDSDPDSEASYKVYSTLAFAAGDDESKAKAIDRLFGFIEAEPTSDRSVDDLIKFATRGDAENKAKAIEILADKNVNHEKMDGVLTTISRGLPSPEADLLLRKVSENATSSKIKANAIMSRISFLDRINSFKSFLSGLDEERLKTYSPEMIEFVNADRDPNEMVDLEKMLEAFIKENESLLKRAEKELFALKFLSVGKEAPEIVGLDIDNVEFKLSDYRGKVVLLDFWGDW